ncbi:MAG: hypothetical protein U0457_02565 [Candidatus Sericytochromatia bacterium]
MEILLIFLLILTFFLFVIPRVIYLIFKALYLKKIAYLPIFIYYFLLFYLFSILSMGYQGDQTRAKVSYTIGNMHRLQTMLETYAVDNNGIYPENIYKLRSAASNKKNYYWIESKNIYNNKKGLGYVYDDFDKKILGNKTVYTKDKSFISFFTSRVKAGVVYYEPIKGDNNKIIKYFIYGSDRKGIALTRDNEIYTLKAEY